MLRKIRLTFAMICFALITLLFLDFTGTLHGWFGWLAKIQFLPAVLALNVGVILFLVILTLVCGRIYCSVICPLGVFQDILAWLGRQPKKRRKLPYSYSPALSWLRYGVLGVFIIALIAGIGSLAALLAPYSAYGRIANNLFQPIWQWGNNLLAYLAERTGRTKILTCPAADTTLHIDYRNLWRILVFRYTRHHLYGSRRTMACTVATLHTIRQWYAIFLYPHGMSQSGSSSFCRLKEIDATGNVIRTRLL